MRGPEHALRLVQSFLEGRLPDQCEDLAARLTEELEADPAIVITPPAFYDIVDHAKLKEAQYPALVVEALPTPPLLKVDIDDAATPIYLVRYPLRVHLYCRTLKESDAGAAELNRNRLVQATAETFLLSQHLGTNGYAAIDDLSMRLLFGDRYADTPGRLISPGAVDVTVALAETLERAPLAEAPTDITVAIQTLED